MVSEASVSRGPLHVISGPTRHHLASIFFVVTSCKTNSTVGEWNLTTCPVDHRDLQAFLLPVRQWKYQHSCISDRDFIAYNVATLKDVERITNFQFFPDLPMEDKLNLLSRTTLDSTLVVDPTRQWNMFIAVWHRDEISNRFSSYDFIFVCLSISFYECNMEIMWWCDNICIYSAYNFIKYCELQVHLSLTKYGK